MLVLVIVVAASLALPLAAWAQEETPEPEPISETTPEPAVSIAPEPPAEDDSEWTTVYLVPTALLIGAGTVLITIIMYFFRVTRARYRPQE